MVVAKVEGIEGMEGWFKWHKGVRGQKKKSFYILGTSHNHYRKISLFIWQ